MKKKKTLTKKFQILLSTELENVTKKYQSQMKELNDKHRSENERATKKIQESKRGEQNKHDQQQKQKHDQEQEQMKQMKQKLKLKLEKQFKEELKKTVKNTWEEAHAKHALDLGRCKKELKDKENSALVERQTRENIEKKNREQQELRKKRITKKVETQLRQEIQDLKQQQHVQESFDIFPTTTATTSPETLARTGSSKAVQWMFTLMFISVVLVCLRIFAVTNQCQMECELFGESAF